MSHIFLYIEAIFDRETVPKRLKVNVSPKNAMFLSSKIRGRFNSCFRLFSKIHPLQKCCCRLSYVLDLYLTKIKYMKNVNENIISNLKWQRGRIKGPSKILWKFIEFMETFTLPFATWLGSPRAAATSRSRYSPPRKQGTGLREKGLGNQGGGRG